MQRSSRQRILWATSVIGGATLAALVIGLARNKAVALIGGPAAIGLFGLFTTLVATVAALATFGLDSSTVRLLSQRISVPHRGGQVRWAAWSIAWPLALVGAAAFYLFREPLAEVVVGDRSLLDQVGWLGIGVAASVLFAVQLAVIQAYGHIGDAARVRVWGGIGSTILGVAAVYYMGIAGIAAAVVLVPAVNFVVAAWFARRLPPMGEHPPTRQQLLSNWYALISLGAAVTLTQAVGNLSALAGRAIVTQKLGLDAAGLFHASNVIVSVNFTLLLNAMAADYYPRLSQVANDRVAMNQVLNEQVHVMLVLAAPVLVIISMAASVLLELLYSGDFVEAALLMRFFVAANVLRLVAWALCFVLLARGAGGSYLLGEVAGASFVPAIWFLVPVLGLSAAGPAAMIWAVSLYAVYVTRARSLGVSLNRQNVVLAVLVVGLLLALAIAFELNFWAGLAIGAAGSAALSWRAVDELRVILARRPTS